MFSALIKFSLIFAILPSFADIAWHNDLDKALEEAKDKKKPVLIEFTGSDWCAASEELAKQVLQSSKFEAATRGKYIFVRLDFPKNKTQDDTQVEKNEVWKNKLGIRGLPTVVMMDEHGLPYASMTGCIANPDIYLRMLSSMNQNRIVRDAALQIAAASEGKKQVAALVKALTTVPEESRELFYGSELKKLEEVDTADSTGFLKEQRYRSTLFAQDTEIHNVLGQYWQEVRNGDKDNVITALANMEKDDKWLPESRQKLMLAGFFLKYEKMEGDRITQTLKEIVDLSPRSQEANMARQMIRNFQHDKKIHRSVDTSHKSGPAPSKVTAP